MALQTHIRFSLLLLIASLLSAAVSAATTISPGSSLSAANLNTTWSSPSDTFSLGFIPSDPPTSPPSYIAAISYSGGVPVWSAGAGKAVDSGGTLQFLQSGTLRLVNGSGATLWDSNTASLGVSSAEITDSGNLVLRNGTVTVWSSFDNPTDSIVPGQNLTVGKVLRSGLYSFKLVKNGNLTLLWNDSIVYWNQGLNSSVNTNVSSPTLGLQSIGILSITDPKLSTAAIVAYSNDYAEAGDILRFLKLGSDGNLRIYSSTRGSGAITERWAAVTNQCEVFGYCGDMGVCSYNDSNPVCGCMSLNFELVDPKDSRKGCKRKMKTEDCPQNLTMLDLVHTRFLTYPPETETQIFFVGISACRSNCLVNSVCDASTSLSDGTGLCYYKTPGFLSGYHSPAMSSSSYIKVCGPVIPNPSSSMGTGDKKKDWKLRAWIVVVVVIATLFALMALEGGLWWWFCRNSPAFGGLLVDQDVDMDQVKRAIQVTFWCIQEQPSHRPMMGKVLQMLEGITDIETPPGPRAAIEGSAGGTSMNVSTDITTLSATAASAPAPSSFSSVHVSGVSPLTSGRNTEKATASLIQSSSLKKQVSYAPSERTEIIKTSKCF
ncbi:hypothetical protein DVH24_037608 [Malus domestica]|uniref:non-specific serine/threonine protein kinase n=1 Tax=Malus domestica TaxID=3750 RepID=A0A498J299_MALDO|nr:hypothetical protein DVH24_037608 [Malus domestica]